MAPPSSQSTSLSLEDATCGGPTFSLFARLPRELQSLIWTHAIPGPRIIEVGIRRLKKFYENSDSHINAFESFQVRGMFGGFQEVSCPCPPVLLHVCQESRRVALTSFKTCIIYYPEVSHIFYEKSPYIVTKDGLKVGKDKIAPREKLFPHGIWFQPKLDTIFFRSPPYGIRPGNSNSDEYIWSNLESFNIDFSDIRRVAFEVEMFYKLNLYPLLESLLLPKENQHGKPADVLFVFGESYDKQETDLSLRQERFPWQADVRAQIRSAVHLIRRCDLLGGGTPPI